MDNFFRWPFLAALVTPVLITMSCSHLSNRKDTLTPEQEVLLLAYQNAKNAEATDTLKSCSSYTELAKNDLFTLKTLALIRAHIVCADRQALAPIPENISDQQPWLTEIDVDRQIIEAEKSQDSRLLSQSQFKKSQKQIQVREKIQWLEKAFETSKKIDNPTKEDLSQHSDLQTRIYQLSPRLLPNPGAPDYNNVANDFFYHRQFDKGRSFLKKIKSGKGFSLEEQYQARRAYRNSFKTEQKKSDHVDEAGRFAKWTVKKSSPTRIHEAYVTWARAEWTLGNASSARKILSQAEKVLNKSHPLDEILFIRARMAEENHNLDKALDYLARAEKETKGQRSLRDRILFSQAWLLRKKAQYPEAVAALTKLKNETQDPFDKNRYMFWLARSLKQSNRPAEANTELQELIQNDPLGYYGLIAYRELNSDIPALEIERKLASEEIRPPNISSLDFQTVRALSTVREFDILEKFLDIKTLELKGQAQQDLQTWMFYLKAYAQAGLYNPLFQQVGSLQSDLKSTLLAQNPELLFPRNYLDIITANAEKYGVRPELMLSIIRQESAFNPMARSPADAFGLMQVIPSAAKLHEKNTGIQIESHEDLYKPELNIPLGASLLADLGKKYRGQFVLTAAAYNASERAIEGWLKTRLKDDPLEFIEDIPYEETKGYVKLVLRNFIFYSRLANPGKTLAFPNWCLDDLQSFKISTR